MEEERKIPYVGCVRVGNFKLWKSRVKDRKSDVLHISDLDGTWAVKIPQTYLAFTMIEQCYQANQLEFIQTYLANVNFVSAISNGFYQRAVAMVGHVYMMPELLEKGYKPENGPGHKDLMDETRKICEGFLKWYDEAKREEKEREQQAGDVLSADEAADAAAQALAEAEKETT